MIKFDVKKNGDLKIDKKTKELKKLIKNLDVELAKIAKAHFLKSFPKTKGARGGRQTDDSSGGWESRRGKPRHPALNDTGRLIRSIIRRKNVVKTNLDYANYHNSGGGRLPRREFIGPSRKLNRISKKYIKDEVKKILKD